MDKRSLSSGRDTRGRKRAMLSDESGITDIKNYSKVTIHDQFKKFLDIKRSEGISERRKKDLLNDKGYFVNFLKSKGYSELMEDVTTSIIREWSIEMQEQYVVYQTHVRGGKRKGLAPVTINGRIKTIKHFYNVLMENGLWERNEAAPVKLLKQPIDTVEGLTEDQVRALLRACKKSTYTGFRDFTLIMLGIDCGLRAGELVALNEKSFDFEIGVVKVDDEIAKNGKARIVPVSRKVLNLIQKLLTENKINFGSDHVFMTAYGQTMTTKGIVRQFGTIRKNAGLNGVKASCHVLRHTFAKFYIQNGGDAFTLQKLLGHSRMDIVRMYIQMNAVDIAEAHRRFSPANKFRV
ncbi:integrase [Paenibacillus sp. FSL R7-277]|uniref:tyrosine-type recombinase/integrase n=1 Tax=Paenibacillus sp. FSL R7-277 TaxID=1227352 RepID=UPI0003E21FA7|nr:tyrosine-type recombinase/integrase [Paenibacillus sp. FSL R7-277]ETT77504.1 integrase [Paenibacillus sp. FSL R7-277]